MTETVLHLEGVGKRYAAYPSLLRRMASWFNLGADSIDVFWAVRDVSVRLQKGECIGLIGRNGAGKSTLLKLITGTIRPNEGAIHSSGKISAILELGLGFHPELTGEQNVHQAGGLLGYAHAELTAMMPAIRDFCELGKFFDEPVRTYSSGMVARLAFALATARRPEILIVDEVLSVGDAYFQHKSFERIRQFRDEGTTILLVTHAMGDVRALCSRALLMHGGHVVRDGPVDDVLDYYNAGGTGQADDTIQQFRRNDGWLQTRSGTGAARIGAIRLLDAATGQPIVKARVGQRLRIEMETEINEPVEQFVAGVQLTTRTGHLIWGTSSWYADQVLHDLEPAANPLVVVDFECTLGPGSYALTVALTRTRDHTGGTYDWIDNCLVFEVENTDRAIFVGSTFLDATFTVSRDGSQSRSR